MADWGGAQWVLATWWAVWLIVPMFVRVAGLRGASGERKSAVQFAGFYLHKIISTATLAVVLWWGGFWG